LRWCYSSKLLQASDHADGLQVQNVSGEWINVPPRPYTFVINIGKGTHGCRYGALTSRYLPPLSSLVYVLEGIIIIACVLTFLPATSRRIHRIREGHSRARTGDIASRTSPCCRHLTALFNSILPEPCAGCAAQRPCATTYVLSPTLFPTHEKKFCFFVLLIRFMLAAQSLLRCSGSKGVVQSSARQSVSMITESLLRLVWVWMHG